MKYSRTVSIGAAVMAAALLAGCSGGGGGGGTTDTVKISLDTEPGSIVPLSQPGFIVHQISRFAYDSLVTMDENGEVVSNIADTWEFDGTTATFHISEGVTCSDGAAFTAETAENNFLWHQNPDNGSAKIGAGLGGRTDYTVASDEAAGTVTVTLPEPNSSFLNQMFYLPMVCQSGLDDEKSLQDSTAGTGPYVLSSSQQDVLYSYDKRDGYTWGPGGSTSDDEGFPEHVEIHIITDQNAAINQFVTGAVNLVGVENEEAHARVADIDGVSEAAGTQLRGLMLFNQREGSPAAETDFRVALTRAVDWDVATEVIGGSDVKDAITRANGLAQYSPMMCQTNPSAKDSTPGYDPAAAEQALDALGYAKGSDGWRTKPDGSPLELTFLSIAGERAEAAAAEYVTGQWESIGVHATVESNNIFANIERMGTQMDWTVGWYDAGYSLPSQWSFFFSDTPTNVSGVENAKYLDIAHEAYAAPTASDACALWGDAEAVLWSEANVVSLGQAPLYFVGRDGVSSDSILTPALLRVG